MRFKAHIPKSMFAPQTNEGKRRDALGVHHGDSGDPKLRGGFTLIEVLLALVVLSILMVVVHSVFYGAIQLRNTVDQTIQNAMPLQHALRMIKRDVANLTIPGGTLTGTLQTPLVANSTMSSQHDGEQCGPTFYTASGTIDDLSPWSEMRKVTYYLQSPTNQSEGLDLVRSVTRNLLPVTTEEYVDQRLLSGVERLDFQFYDGNQWVDEWDSTTASSTGLSSVPGGIRVQLWMAQTNRGAISEPAIEMVIPIAVNATNTTENTTGDDQ